MRSAFNRFLLIALVLAGIVFLTNSYQGYSDQGTGLKLWFFDVGQGDAVMMETPDGHQVMVDGGPDSSILRSLSRAMPLSDKTIDLLIITHNHSDHITGVIEILKHYEVGQIWVTGAIHTTDTYQRLLTMINDKNIKTKAVQAGESYEADGLKGIVIHPLESVVGQSPDNQNAISLVTFWQYGSTTVLLPGDLEAAQEQALLKKGLLKPTTILKVGHQGSKTSSSESFLNAIQPKVAVIMVGPNSYGHPHQVALDNLQKIGAKILRTDRDKTIRFDISESDYSYKTGI